MILTANVGPAHKGDCDGVQITVDRTSALRVSPSFYEEAELGEIFYASTPAAGVDHAASLTTTAPFSLYNPVGSPVNCVLLGVTWGYVSGTLGGGFLALGQYIVGTTNAVPTGTAALSGCTLLGQSNPRGVPLYTVTLTAGATLICGLKDIAPKLATTAAETVPSPIWLPPIFIAAPGTALVLSGVTGAGGTTPLVQLGTIWREIKRRS